MAAGFAHLHLHTEFSMLDGAARVSEVVAAAVADGQPAIAITDHGAMYGVLDFYTECRNRGIKPIVGLESYMAHESRFERPPRRGRVDDTGGDAEAGQKLYYHLTLLAENNEGYRNLVKLSSESYLQGYWYKARCLLPGQEIVTRTGAKPIDEIRPGDEVLTHKGRFRKVTQTMSRHYIGDIVGLRLNARYERVTWMTAEHPVLVRGRDGSLRWIEAGCLEPGRPDDRDIGQNWNSWVCLPKVQRPSRLTTSIETADHVSWAPAENREGYFKRTTPRSRIGPTFHYTQFPQTLHLDYDLGYFIGLYVAEGDISRTEVRWTFHRDEQHLVDHCAVIAEKLTGKTVVTSTRPDRDGYKGVVVRCSSAVLAQLLGNLCGKGAANKQLPEFVFETPLEFQKGLVDGVLDGDGSFSDNAIIFTQSSRNLAWQMRTLRATLHDDFPCVTERVLLDERHSNQYRSNYSPLRIQAFRTTLADEHYVYKPLGEIHSRRYDGPVFNIEVEDDHSYVSDFAIHNCDWELLEQHSRGLIATTGCLGGHVLQALLRGDRKAALASAGRLQDIFGRDNLFVELQDHGHAEQRRTNPELIEIAHTIGAPLLATNDSHYVRREDAVAHDALLCVQTGAMITDQDRFRFEGDEHYLKTAAEMRALFAELPEACDNTLWIAERANVEIDFGNVQLPDFPVPEGFADGDEYLRHVTIEGAKERWGDSLPTEVVERLSYELQVISDMGFSSYFLIVWDLIAYARRRGIRVGPGRGSAAGCAVSYSLRITDLDPIKYDLLFERFLNPGRKQLPDIDMDFDDRYRDEMIRYAADRYGRDHVAQIVTFSTIKARAAVRDAARVLGYPYSLGDRIAKAMPPLVMGRDTPLYACFEKEPKYEDGYAAARELRDIYEADPEARRVIDVARGLEGLRRQDSIHAAAVVITQEPLTEHLPIQRKPENGQDPEQAPIVTQYEMGGVEALGLLKMDFLGLRNLSVIETALDLIEHTTGTRPDIDAIPLDDDATLALLRRADSIGVFQLEGTPMRALMRSLAPTSFDDVAALVALYRPGPMAANMHNDYADRKNGRKPVSYLHPDAEEILGDTYGLCLAGDTIVHDALTGRPVRLDEVAPEDGFWIQGVDSELRPVARRVTHWVCNGERSTLRLRLANGMELTGTPEHRVLGYDGWTKLADLVPGDRVAVPKELLSPLNVASISRDRLRVLGYLLADGCLSVSSVIQFTNSDPVLLDEFTAVVASAFPTTKICTSQGERVTALQVGNGRGHGGGPSPLLVWLRELGLKAPAGSHPGGPKSQHKFVPDVVFSLDDDDVAFFLASLWDCDGHVNERFAHYRTISHRLAVDVQRLLMRLGFEAPVYEATYDNHGEPRVAYQVTIYDGPRFAALIAPYLASQAKRDALFTAESRGSVLRRSEVVSAIKCAWPGSLRSLAREFGLPRWHLMPYALERTPTVRYATVAPIVEALELERIAQQANVLWIKVSDVELAPPQRVYDISVEEIHNFVANGVVVHNCIYQEQVMRLAEKFAGYSLTDADNLRKAAGKKVREAMARERSKFVDGCERQGYGRELGTMLFDIIEPFADYAFNKAHSYGYGLIAYQTAWLKAHHPVEYLAALLTSVKDNQDRSAVYLNECRQCGIQVLVPDVNRSSSDFAPHDGEILFGLSAVRNVGEGLVQFVIEERDRNGPFRDFYDFCERVDPQVLNKRAVESLVKAGGFDSLGHPRRGLLVVFEQIIDATIARRRERDQGVMSLFADGGTGEPAFDERVAIPDLEFDRSQTLAYEKEMLGLYVSDHPLMGAQHVLRRRTDATIAEVREQAPGELRSIGGVVTSLQRKYTKRGELMAVFVLEDLEAAIEVMVFPKVMADHGAKLTDDAVVCIRGRLDTRDDTPKLICSDIVPIDVGIDGIPPVRINLPATAASERTIADLKRLLSDHPGEAPVFLHLGERVLRLPDEFSVDARNGLVGELRVLLGANAILA